MAWCNVLGQRWSVNFPSIDYYVISLMGWETHDLNLNRYTSHQTTLCMLSLDKESQCDCMVVRCYCFIILHECGLELGSEHMLCRGILLDATAAVVVASEVRKL